MESSVPSPLRVLTHAGLPSSHVLPLLNATACRFCVCRLHLCSIVLEYLCEFLVCFLPTLKVSTHKLCARSRAKPPGVIERGYLDEAD